MSTNVTFQTIAILLKPGASITEDDFLNDTGIQSCFANSLGNDAIFSYQQYYNNVGGVNTPLIAYTLTFLVTPAFASSMISGIPAMKTRLLPTHSFISDIVTWGYPVAFG